MGAWPGMRGGGGRNCLEHLDFNEDSTLVLKRQTDASF